MDKRETLIGDVLYRYVYTCHKDKSAIQGQQNVILKDMEVTGEDKQPHWNQLELVHKQLERQLKEEHHCSRCSVHKLSAILLEDNTPQMQTHKRRVNVRHVTHDSIKALSTSDEKH